MGLMFRRSRHRVLYAQRHTYTGPINVMFCAKPKLCDASLIRLVRCIDVDSAVTFHSLTDIAHVLLSVVHHSSLHHGLTSVLCTVVKCMVLYKCYLMTRKGHIQNS